MQFGAKPKTADDMAEQWSIAEYYSVKHLFFQHQPLCVCVCVYTSLSLKTTTHTISSVLK